MVMSKSSVKTRPLNTRTYEQCLAEDARWALDEGSRYFSSDSDVHSALRKICKLFHDLNIPYAVSGGLALFAHGYRRFLTLWRNKFLTIDAHSIDEMIDTLGDAAETLRAMRDAGVTLDPGGGTADDYAYLTTTDPDVARKFDMHDESEFWGEDLEGPDTEGSDE